jgi:hypothetical protein
MSTKTVSAFVVPQGKGQVVGRGKRRCRPRRGVCPLDRKATKSAFVVSK